MKKKMLCAGLGLFLLFASDCLVSGTSSVRVRLLDKAGMYWLGKMELSTGEILYFPVDSGRSHLIEVLGKRKFRGKVKFINSLKMIPGAIASSKDMFQEIKEKFDKLKDQARTLSSHELERINYFLEMLLKIIKFPAVGAGLPTIEIHEEAKKVVLYFQYPRFNITH